MLIDKVMLHKDSYPGNIDIIEGQQTLYIRWKV